LTFKKMTLHLSTPKPDEVIAEMEAKGIGRYELIRAIGLSSQTFYAFINGDRVSQRTIERIVNYINSK